MPCVASVRLPTRLVAEPVFVQCLARVSITTGDIKGMMRLSVMLFLNGSCRFKDDEVDKQAWRLNEEWVGCTIFYTDRLWGVEAQKVYPDTLD